MRKAISILLVLVICMSMAITAFATNGGQQTGVEGEFIMSPGEGGGSCDHANTSSDHKKDPTCTEDGYYGREICEECGEIINPGKVIPSKGHVYKDDVCTECGEHYDPKTGDISVVLWVVLMVVAATALVAITVVYRKKA